MDDPEARELTDEEVAQAVAGADKLMALYGWATPFHDAVVERVVIERLGPTVTMDLRTNEVAVGGIQALARVTVRWEGVQDLYLRGADPDEGNWIFGMRFYQAEALFRTDILEMDGIHGWILAEKVVIESMEPLPWGTPLAESQPA